VFKKRHNRIYTW